MSLSERVNPHDADTATATHEAWFTERLRQLSNGPAKKLRGKKGGKKARNPVEGNYVVGTCDFETDPFRGPGYPIRPFAAGFYDGTTYVQFWGGDCPRLLAEHIRGLDKPHVIYAHNGGRFDFMYLLDWIERDVFCIGPRIVKAYIVPKSGHAGTDVWRHELRDSLSIIPVPLKHAAEKHSFDYDKMLEGKRERYKQEISDYLKQDCIGLHETVLKYRVTFGGALTMAGAAMRKLNEAMRPMLGRTNAAERMREQDDEFYRRFYYGGRVEAIEVGIIEPRKEPLKNL